jgi:hypothetical protein
MCFKTELHLVNGCQLAIAILALLYKKKQIVFVTMLTVTVWQLAYFVASNNENCFIYILPILRPISVLVIPTSLHRLKIVC